MVNVTVVYMVWYNFNAYSIEIFLEMLEEQLAQARLRADKVLELKAEVLSCQKTINELKLVSVFTLSP